MPTPFSHLEIAQRLLVDDAIPQAMRDLLQRERPAFLFGSVAPDARIDNQSRSATHFYDFAQGITESPWRVMMAKHPEMLQPSDTRQQAFIAGYIAHLGVDENWSKQMVAPYFVEKAWAEGHFRFFVLQILLSYMDARDLAQLQGWHAPDMARSTAHDWLPFAPDDMLNQWKDFITAQLQPGGEIQTLNVFAERLGRDPADLRAFLDSAEEMEKHLWCNIPPEALREVEAQGYALARQQLIRYLSDSKPA